MISISNIQNVDDFFPNLNVTLGYYDPHFQVIQINNIDLSRYDHLMNLIATLSSESSLHSLTDLSVLAHELTHFIDHLSTLWGQRYLISTFNAIHSITENSPYKYDYISVFYREALNIGLKSEHDLQTQGVMDSQIRGCKAFIIDPCELDPMIGKPIISIQYFSGSIVSPVRRSPISILSMLETRAVCAEYMYFSFLVNQIYGDKECFDEDSLVQNLIQRMEQLGFLEYSNVSWYLQARYQIFDPIQLYIMTSILSWITLNFPNSLFSQIVVPGDWDISSSKYLEAMLDANDRGLIFYLLCIAGIDCDYKDLDSWISSLLHKLSLPSYSKIMNLARQEMDSLQDMILSGPECERLQALLEIGYSNFGSVQREGIPFLVQNPSSYSRPMIKLSDGIQFYPYNSPNILDDTDWFTRAESYFSQLDSTIGDYFGVK